MQIVYVILNYAMQNVKVILLTAKHLYKQASYHSNVTRT